MSFFKYSFILKKYYKYILLIILLIVIGIGVYFLYFKKLDDSEIIEPIVDENIDIVLSEEDNTKDVEIVSKKIYVDIKGMINNPGVYELDEGSKVIDLINISGGLKDGADTSLINLSKKLKDEMVVIIYSQEEVNKTENNTVVKYIEKTCVCPEVKNDVCINTSNDSNNVVNNIETNEEEDTNIYPISINTADINTLTKLPSIGEAKAKKIIEYRDTNGEFETIEDIMNVSGIGESIFDAIKDFITI